MATYMDAVLAVDRIAERYQLRAGRAGVSPASRRDAVRWEAQAEALREAAAELRADDGDAEEDTADVPAPVFDLVDYLVDLVGPDRQHPLAGGAGGHCTPCRAVGHLVAHPDRDCAAVGCDGTHDRREDDTDQDRQPVRLGEDPTVIEFGFDPATTLMMIP